jgi:serine/threonine-protein kinase
MGAVLFPQIFGKYVLERPLAVGGMARVFLATLRGAGGFEKKLVVKQIRAELATDDAFVRRFVAEAKTTVELAHPNIVPVYELGVEQGIYYLAMELCDGVTLGELLKTGRLSPEEGAYLGIEICRALDYAHRKARIIHRDVTPRNVVIDEEGAVRLIDFGISAPAYDGAKEVFGSPGHMPPEQLRGEEVGPPADVFAVATLLYEAWSAHPPFRRRTPEQSQSALSEPVAALSTFDPALAPLDALIASAMALDPAARPQSAEELSRPLRKFIAARDRGDLTRKVGERVRDLRASGELEAGTELAQVGGVTPVVNETRTFATRSLDAVEKAPRAVPSKPPPRQDTAPQMATRRMSDDPGSWSSGGGRAATHASTRPDRSVAYKGWGGIVLGLLVVTVAGGAAWQFGKPERPPSTEPSAQIATQPLGATVPGTIPTATAGRELTGTITTAGTNVEAPARPEEEPPATLAGENPRGATVVAKRANDTPAPIASSPSKSPPTRVTKSNVTSDPPTIAPIAAESAGATELAHLRILANPMANVEIDGKPRGVAPIADVALPPGTHFVRLDCAALGEAVAQNVPLAPGENVTISGDFTGAHGRILVRRAGATP